MQTRGLNIAYVKALANGNKICLNQMNHEQSFAEINKKFILHLLYSKDDSQFVQVKTGLQMSDLGNCVRLYTKI